MKNLWIALFLVFTVFLGVEVSAWENYDSRITAFIRAKKNINEPLKLTATVVFPEMQQGLTNKTFLGLQIKYSNCFSFEPRIGWGFSNNQPIVALAFSPIYGNFWTFGVVNITLPNQNGYWFFQAEYNFNFWNKMLSMGLEGEGWGNYGNQEIRWSNGGGPTIDFRFKYFELETSLQVRDYNREAGTEFQVRIYFHLGE